MFSFHLAEKGVDGVFLDGTEVFSPIRYSICSPSILVILANESEHALLKRRDMARDARLPRQPDVIDNGVYN